MTAEILFEIRDLAFTYDGKNGGAKVLEVPSLSIVRGERLLLRGPNGSGKTSLLKLLNDLLVPTEGEILFRGRPANGSAELRERSVYVHQNPLILAGSVSYNVGLGAARLRLPKRKTAERVREVLARVGLAGFGHRGSRALSGGEAQRVAIARAIATGADILLLDEPTASVDADSARLIRRLLDEEAARGATILVSTHDEALARDLGGRTLRFEAGRIVEDSGSST